MCKLPANYCNIGANEALNFFQNCKYYIEIENIPKPIKLIRERNMILLGTLKKCRTLT